MQDLAKKLHTAFAEAVARPATHPSGKNQDDHNAMVKQCVDGLARLSDDHRRHARPTLPDRANGAGLGLRRG